MAQVIEFKTLARFTPTVKWTPNHQRGKVIPFISQRGALYKPVCPAYEELDSESSRWPDRDEALYRASLEYAQPLILEEEPLSEGRAPDEVYAEVRKEFGEEELVNLSLAIITINGWNRPAIGFRKIPGEYQPHKID